MDNEKFLSTADMGSPIYNPDVGAKNSHSIESLNNVIFDPSLRVHYTMNGQVAISQPLIFIVYRLSPTR